MSTEQYADMQFPSSGLDLSYAFGAQRPGSTRQGVNVRGYEPAERRARGGSRPGLSRYINDQPGGAVHLVQHLNYVVDPRSSALTDYDPPGDITGGPNLLLPGPEGDGGYTDPTGSPRDTSARRLRYGGTGVRLSRKRRNSDIYFVQGASGSAGAGAGSIAYTANVTAGSLLLAMVFMQPSALGNTASLTDTRGNSWSRAGNYSTATFSGNRSLSLWYAVANAAGSCTVTATASDPADAVVVGVGEYGGTKASSPLDGTADNTQLAAIGAGGTYTATTGNVAVSQARSLVVGVFSDYDAASATALSPFTVRAILTAGSSVSNEWQDHIGASALEAATRSVTAQGSVKHYLAVGASFKPRVP